MSYIDAAMRRLLAILLMLGSQGFCQVAGKDVRHILLDVVDIKDHVQLDDLTGSNFRVMLNGSALNVMSAERVAIRPRVALLLDTSASMRIPAKWDCSVELAKASFEALKPIADVSYLDFADRDEPYHPLLENDQISNALNYLKEHPKPMPNRFVSSGTALRDSVVYAIKQFKLRSGDAVLLVTDGGDNTSVESRKKLENEIFRSGVRVFAIVLGGYVTREEREGIFDTTELTQKTGGTYERLGRAAKANWRISSFNVTDQEKALIPKYGEYIARRIVLPYVLVVDAPPAANGKLLVSVTDKNGGKRKDVMVFAPMRLESDVAASSLPN